MQFVIWHEYVMCHLSPALSWLLCYVCILRPLETKGGQHSIYAWLGEDIP